jgi:hypothetical protein
MVLEFFFSVADTRCALYCNITVGKDLTNYRDVMYTVLYGMNCSGKHGQGSAAELRDGDDIPLLMEGQSSFKLVSMESTSPMQHNDWLLV